ncbi:MAG TPA: hypothetical protein VE338_16610 [Ktedonobacterales bacterium]|jgi:hypothetical protein|nr:hypothetical protein [Ktedonobacterales bacterium]
MMTPLGLAEVEAELRAYLEASDEESMGSTRYTLADLAHVYAVALGSREDDSCYWIVELTDGRFLLTRAESVEDGEGLTVSGESWEAPSAGDAASIAPQCEPRTYRDVRAHLLAQLCGAPACAGEEREEETRQLAG